MGVSALCVRARCSVLIPVAVGLIERSPVRRRIIVGFGVLATAVAIVLLAALFRGPIHTVIDGRHIAYDVDALHFGAQLTALYVIATCGALLACSYRDIATIGALNLVVVPVLMWTHHQRVRFVVVLLGRDREHPHRAASAPRVRAPASGARVTPRPSDLLRGPIALIAMPMKGLRCTSRGASPSSSASRRWRS